MAISLRAPLGTNLERLSQEVATEDSGKNWQDSGNRNILESLPGKWSVVLDIKTITHVANKLEIE